MTDEEGVANVKQYLGGVEIVEVECPPCTICGLTSIMTVDKEGLDKYNAGAFVQDAFPRMSAEYREMLVTGIHPDCWEKHIAPLAEDYEG